MAELVLPTGLAATAASGAEPGLADWVRDELPGLVARASAAWGLQLLPPYQPGGYCSWVAPGVDAGGRSVVLKVGWPHPESAAEAAGLRAWAGDGAVRLLDVLALGDAEALLLERCEPGTTLGALPEADQDVVLGGLLRRLHAVRPPDGLPTLEAMCALWARGSRGRSVLPADLVEAGFATFAALASSGPAGLLATDLHAGNVLAAQREPWLVVDPKPHVGDPAYDVTQHLLNCPDRLVADPVGLCSRVAGLAGVDAERVVRWIFARCVVETAERVYAAELVRRLAPVALG